MIAVLFARSDSVYKSFSECDVYDIERDARTWPGGCPVVAHPPCRGWGALRYFAKPAPGEKDLALLAIKQVRANGGVLEHPLASSLWPVAGLPKPGHIDEYGGWTMPISQSWFGHKAEKRTFLYIVGCSPRDVPAFPLSLKEASHVIASSRRINGRRMRKGDPGWRPEVSEAEREHTPAELAAWLVDLAKRCS